MYNSKKYSFANLLKELRKQNTSDESISNSSPQQTTASAASSKKRRKTSEIETKTNHETPNNNVVHDINNNDNNKKATINDNNNNKDDEEEKLIISTPRKNIDSKWPCIEVAVLVGLTGCGKSTFARSHFRAFAHVDKAVLRKRKNFSRHWKEEQLIRQFIAQKRNVVVDASHLKLDSRTSILKTIREAALENQLQVKISGFVFYKKASVRIMIYCIFNIYVYFFDS